MRVRIMCGHAHRDEGLLSDPMLPGAQNAVVPSQGTAATSQAASNPNRVLGRACETRVR